MKVQSGNHGVLALGAMALAFFALGAAAFAAKESEEKSHDGKLVSISDKMVVMTDKSGKEHSHTLAPDAQLTLDGKACEPNDLKAGTSIRVTTHAKDAKVATCIEAIQRHAAFSKTHDGTVVSVASKNLVMKNKRGKEHSHVLAPETKITLDGMPCKVEDLKAGTRIRVTTHANDWKVLTHIEAINKQETFVNTHEGKVVSMNDNSLVMMESQGKEERTCNLPKAVEVTCDGKACRISDLKAGMRIRVTTEDDDPSSAISIEAIEKNRDFAKI